MTENNNSKGDNNIGSIVVMIIFSIAIVSLITAFVCNHMCNTFESEYKNEVKYQTNNFADLYSDMVSGDEMASDINYALTKYSSIFPAVIVSFDEDMQKDCIYALYYYQDSSIELLFSNSEQSELVSNTVSQEKWLFTDGQAFNIEGENEYSVFSPIYTSDGNIIGVFELTSNFEFLDSYTSSVESVSLRIGVITSIIAVLLFLFIYLIPFFIQIINRRGEAIK